VTRHLGVLAGKVLLHAGLLIALAFQVCLVRHGLVLGVAVVRSYSGCTLVAELVSALRGKVVQFGLVLRLVHGESLALLLLHALVHLGLLLDHIAPFILNSVTIHFLTNKDGNL
jgi:hypothetical protein